MRAAARQFDRGVDIVRLDDGIACQRVGAATVADPVWIHGLRRPDSQTGLDGLVAGPRHTGLPFRHMLGAVRGRAKVRARVIGK